MTFSARFQSGAKQATVSASCTGEAGRRCGLRFNPTDDGDVTSIKGFCASAMQSVIKARHSIQAKRPGPEALPAENDGYQDAMRCFATALTLMEQAQMMAVKGLFAQRNATEQHD